MKKNSIQYKDSAFCLLFSEPGKLRALYNALSGASYGEETPVTITTLKNVLSQGLRNDLSFTIGDKAIVLIEHSSTINPNMPARFLLYSAAIYENLIPRRDLYSRQKMMLPRPEFYMLYNGTSDFPDKTILRLSDLYTGAPKDKKYCLELEVEAYNINMGYNKELMEKTRELGEYAQFVDLVRKKKTIEEDPEEAFRLAIKECIDNNILKEFLEEYGEEVMSSLLSISMEEFYQIRTEEAMAEGRAKGREDGLAEGRAIAEEEGRQKMLVSARKMKEAGLSADQIKTFTGLSPEEIEGL